MDGCEACATSVGGLSGPQEEQRTEFGAHVLNRILSPPGEGRKRASEKGLDIVIRAERRVVESSPSWPTLLQLHQLDHRRVTKQYRRRRIHGSKLGQLKLHSNTQRERNTQIATERAISNAAHLLMVPICPCPHLHHVNSRAPAKSHPRHPTSPQRGLSLSSQPSLRGPLLRFRLHLVRESTAQPRTVFLAKLFGYSCVQFPVPEDDILMRQVDLPNAFFDVCIAFAFGFFHQIHPCRCLSQHVKSHFPPRR